MSQHYFIAETRHIQAFKVLFDVVKDLIQYISITFNNDGMIIKQINKDNSMGIYAKLYGDQFSKYSCLEQRIVSIDSIRIHKILKNTKTSNLITFFQTRDLPEFLQIQVQSDNRQCTVINKIQIIDIQINQIYDKMIQTPFTEKIILSSNLVLTQFKNLLAQKSDDKLNIYIMNDKVQIQTKADNSDIKINFNLIFNQSSDNTKNKNSIKNKSHTDQLAPVGDLYDTRNIKSGEFNLKNLTKIAKCSSLSKQVELYMEDDSPLVLKYEISPGIGLIDFILNQYNQQN